MNPVDPTARDRDDYYESLLGAAAFGTLTAEEEAGLRVYLATSDSARAELAELVALAGDLSLLVDEREPSPGLRSRIAAAIAAEPAAPTLAPNADDRGGIRPIETSSQPTPIQQAPGWRNYIWAAAASLLIAILAGVALDRVFLQDADDDDSRETIAFELSLATPVPELSAELTYDSEQQLFLLETEGMPPPPEGQIYQIWLIDAAGRPKPVGLMDDSVVAVAADREAYDAFAITLEPGPIGSPAPTTEPFFVAPLAAGDE